MSGRAAPFHCPYCGDEDLRPHGTRHGAWECRACLRAFSLSFIGLIPAGGDVPDRTLTRRLVHRHRTHGRADDQARDWVHTVDLPNAAAVARTRCRADLVWKPVP